MRAFLLLTLLLSVRFAWAKVQCADQFRLPQVSSLIEFYPSCESDANASRAIQAVTNASLENFEKDFFSSVRIRQIDETKCSESFLAQVDQEANLPEPRKCFFVESVVTSMQGTRKADTSSKAYQAQRQILIQAHQSMAVIRSLKPHLNKAQRDVQAAQRLLRVKRGVTPRNTSSERRRVQDAETELSFWQQAMDAEYGLIWSSGDPEMQKFLERSLARDEPLEKFLERSLNPNSTDSLQCAVISKMRIKNRQRLRELESSKDTVSESLRKDFVRSGAAFLQVNSLAVRDMKDYSDLACYLEGRYGDKSDTGKLIAARGAEVGSAVALFAGHPYLSFLLGAAAGILEWEHRRGCRGLDYVDSAITKPICEGLRANPNPNATQLIDIVSKDLETRMSCFEAVAGVAAAIPIGKPGKLGRELIKDARELKITEVRKFSQEAWWASAYAEAGNRPLLSLSKPTIREVGSYDTEIVRIAGGGKSSIYEGANDVLVLSDGASQDLGAKISRGQPGARVVSGDVVNSGTISKNNLTIMKIDNTKPLAFADNSFDRVVIKNATCYHGENKNALCGGIPFATKDVSIFMGEMVRVMNKNNPGAMAVVFAEKHGGPDSQLLRIAAENIAKSGRARVRIVEGANGNILSIYFTPAR